MEIKEVIPMMPLFPTVMIVVTFLIIVGFVIFGIRAKTTENRVLFQTLPGSFLYGLPLLMDLLQHFEFTGREPHVYYSDYEVMFFSHFFALIATSVLGMVGLTRVLEEKNIFLTIVSCALIVVLLMYSYLICILTAVYMLLVKGIRKWKKGIPVPKYTQPSDKLE
jgi:hypothetical protein